MEPIPLYQRLDAEQDLLAANPAKLKELEDLFWVEAQKYQVSPPDASARNRFTVASQPSIVAGRTEFTYPGPIVGIPQGTAPSVLNRSFTITANVEVTSAGANGMIYCWGTIRRMGIAPIRGKAGVHL